VGCTQQLLGGGGWVVECEFWDKRWNDSDGCWLERTFSVARMLLEAFIGFWKNSVRDILVILSVTEAVGAVTVTHC